MLYLPSTFAWNENHGLPDHLQLYHGLHRRLVNPRKFRSTTFGYQCTQYARVRLLRLPLVQLVQGLKQGDDG